MRDWIKEMAKAADVSLKEIATELGVSRWRLDRLWQRDLTTDDEITIERAICRAQARRDDRGAGR